MTISPAPRVDFAATIGSWMIGATASTGLLGIMTLQSWIYYTRFPKDPPVLKLLVTVIWSFEALRTALCVYGGYFYSVQHWGDHTVLLSTHWSLCTMVLLTAPIELLAHLFFAHQVRTGMSHDHLEVFQALMQMGKLPLEYIPRSSTSSWIILSVVDFGFGIGSFILAVRDGTFGGIVLGLPKRIADGALGSAIIVDWTITICLVWFFRKNQTARIRTLMQTLMMYAVNFGLLISVFEVVGSFYAITVLASYVIRPTHKLPARQLMMHSDRITDSTLVHWSPNTSIDRETFISRQSTQYQLKFTDFIIQIFNRCLLRGCTM
ncbi:hypothetical protein NP233_g2656 [Leucocoprinus birnbaumii]|uniref:DUF6534 domain-containing protein n=1 Tax=Leucocoprinus birnbaumii TaxID=56174 RepID=A0AAD5VZY2_9AGAR|nr:hypothetical protein NP233_g2656 [Leucocoprinus birnbaumii]